MNSIPSSSAAFNKKFQSSSFTVTDYTGTKYFFVRSFGPKKGFFNIAKCEIVAKDRCIPMGYAGIIPDAVWFSDEQVAEIVSKIETPTNILARTKASLRMYSELRNSWLGKPGKKSKLRLRRKEVVK